MSHYQQAVVKIEVFSLFIFVIETFEGLLKRLEKFKSFSMQIYFPLLQFLDTCYWTH